MTQTSTPRPAATDDLTVGAIVYRGQGKIAHRVVRVDADNKVMGTTVVWITRTTSKPTARPFWVKLGELTA